MGYKGKISVDVVKMAENRENEDVVLMVEIFIL